MSIEYTNPARVDAVDVKPLPHHIAGLQWTASGYGSRIPTRYRVRYLHMDDRLRWHRVYARCYGNAASAYIRVGSRALVLDIHTEHRLQDAKEEP